MTGGRLRTIVAAMLSISVITSCTTGRSTPRAPLTVPETSTTPGPTTTTPAARREATSLSGVCPDPVVIQLAGPLDLWALPEVAAVAVDGNVIAPGRYVGALLDPRTVTPTGIRLELRTAAALPSRNATGSVAGGDIATAMRQDASILLGEVGLDPAALADNLTESSATRSSSSRVAPTSQTGSGATSAAGADNILLVLAPWERSDAAIVWDRSTELNATAIADLVGDVDVRSDPALASYLTRSHLLSPTQVLGGPAVNGKGSTTRVNQGTTTSATAVSARYAHVLADPVLLDLATLDAAGVSPSFQLVDETGWEPYEHALGTLGVNTIDRAACMRALVPILQDATARLLVEPERIVANAAHIATKLDDPFDVTFVRRQLGVATQLRILGTGANRTIGDIEQARVMQNIRAAATSRGLRGPAYPSASKVLALARSLIDRSFTDTTIGLAPRADRPTTASTPRRAA